MDPETIEAVADAVAQAATDPAAHNADGQSTTARPIPDLIDLDRYVAGKAALAGPNRRGGRRSGFNALRKAVFVPKGAV